MIAFFILIALVILLVMITIHEFGHYIAARLLGFSIDEFSIGFGPAVYKKKKKNGEIFSIRILPLGGYCAFTDDVSDDNTDSADDIFGIAQGNADAKNKDDTANSKAIKSRSGAKEKIDTEKTQAERVVGAKIPFGAQKPWKRLIVMLCGPLFNLLSAFLFSFIFIISVGYASPIIDELYINPQTNEPYAVGLEAGDVIVAVNGINIGVLNSFIELVTGVETGETVTFTVKRDGEKKEIAITKQTVLVPHENGYSEQELFGFVQIYAREHVGFFPAIGYSFPYTFKLCGEIFASLGGLLTGNLPLTELNGPIGTVTTIATYSQMSWQYLLLFLPLLACNFAIFNILPIPSLDGVKAIFVIIEWIRKKPINKKVENAIHSIGLMFLLGFVMIIDVIGLILR